MTDDTHPLAPPRLRAAPSAPRTSPGPLAARIRGQGGRPWQGIDPAALVCLAAVVAILAGAVLLSALAGAVGLL